MEESLFAGEMLPLWLTFTCVLLGGGSFAFLHLRTWYKRLRARKRSATQHVATLQQVEQHTTTPATPVETVVQPVVQPVATPPQPVVDGATRIATHAAIQQIPTHVPMLSPVDGRIPVLFDGAQWHYATLGRDGHWGIFGTTGSGKGNLLQIVALGALQLGAQLVVLDAKGGLDYGFCRRVANAKLFAADELSSGCAFVVAEIQRRIKLLAAVDARNLYEYNERVETPLPLFVVVADEIADFTAKDRLHIDTFARMARAVGGVLFVATQYPTANVLSNQTQSNVVNRCVFRLSSSEYTRVALRRQQADGGAYEPSAIPQHLPGIAVLRRDAGTEFIGRAPELTDDLRQQWINNLVSSVCLSANVDQTIPQPDALRQQTDTQTAFQTDSADEPDATTFADDKREVAVALINSGKGRDEVRAMFRRLGWGGLDNNQYSEYVRASRNEATV